MATIQTQKDVDALYGSALQAGAPSMQAMACGLLVKQWRMASMGKVATLPLPTAYAKALGIPGTPEDISTLRGWRALVPLLCALKDAADTQVVA